QNRHPPIPPAP
uniref:Bradykinin-potentiating peptide 11j n=1 Tax=Bothrops jararaca TaxID=8724 RepID=BPPBJ_BOTJA|nr:RecName: Full=Bradykinin-potentiating peptide 11j; Short=BPP-11j [Bothrops jararaca]